MTEPVFPSAPPTAPKSRRVSPVLPVMIAVLVLGLGAGAYGVGRVLIGYVSYSVPSGHMSPTLRAGDRIVVHRMDGRTGGDEVHRGDVVTVYAGAFATSGRNATSVFRVVGLAGDTLSCCTDRRLTVDGKPLTEPYIAAQEQLFGFSTRVPAGSVFVEGDNRGNSDDSRFRGTLPSSAVTGLVVATGTVLAPRPLTPATAFTDAGLPGAPFEDTTLPTLRWWIAGGVVLFLAGLTGVIVIAVRSAGRRRKAAAAPPAH